MDTPDPPEHPPRPAAAHVQPHETAVEDVGDLALRAELDKLDNLSEAQKLERLAESDIILQLGLQSFDPDCADWKTLAGALIEYGYSVLMAWTVTGSIRAMAARANSGAGVRGIERLPEVLRMSEEKAHDLVMDLLEFAVERFRSHSLAKNLWSPTGGASLRTYFIGRCLMSLPDVHEKWQRRECPTYGLQRDDLHAAGSSGLNPAATAVDRATIDEVFNCDGRSVTSTEVRSMFELHDSQGWTNAEIAEALTDAGYPNTEATVRTKMSRARTDARRRQDDHDQP